MTFPQLPRPVKYRAVGNNSLLVYLFFGAWLSTTSLKYTIQGLLKFYFEGTAGNVINNMAKYSIGVFEKSKPTFNWKIYTSPNIYTNEIK